jgi:hypothetical protein
MNMPDDNGQRTVGDILDGLPGAAPIGHNMPPEPTPFEITQKEVDDLYEEALNWCDGEPIANAAQAADIAELKRKIQAAATAGEKRRVAEAKPFDDAKKKVQDAYNPLIHKDKGKTARAIAALNTALAPYLTEIDRQQREQARILNEQRIEAERIAREASMAAAASTNLAAREAAEKLQDDAKAIAKSANAAEKAKPQVHGSGGSKAIGMKSVWTAELVDPAAALAYFRQTCPSELKAWMLEQAKSMIHVGPKPPGDMPGFKITETRVPV